MNGLQSGTPASQLYEQSYKNSNQKSGIQSTLDSSSFQKSGGTNQSLNTTTLPTRLRVVGPKSTTLGVSTAATPDNSQSNQWSILVNVSAVILFTALLLFFFMNFRKLVFENNDQ